jgi:hypothetical protein
MKLARYVPILLLATLLAACGSDAIFAPPDDPRWDIVTAPPGSEDDDPDLNDDKCDGVWVTVVNPDGTTTRTCESPYLGTTN